MTLRQIRTALLLILGLVLVLAAVTYSNALQRGYVVVKFSSLLIGATALLSLSIYYLAIGQRWKELKDPLVYLILAELGVLVLSVITSGQSWISLLGSMPRLMGAITIACFVVAAIALILAVGEDRDRLYVILRVVAVTSAVSALVALYEWPKHPILRPPALVGNAEFLSNYLLIGALVSLALVLTEKKAGWTWLAIISSAIAAVGMSAVKTRGSWLGYGAGVAVLLVLFVPSKLPPDLLKRGRMRFLMLCLTMLGAAILAALFGFATAPKRMEWNLLLPFLPVGGVLFLALPWFLARIPMVRHGLLAVLAAMVFVTGFSVATQRPILPYKVADALRVTQESARGVVRDDTVKMLKRYWLFGCGIENFRVAFLKYKTEAVARADPRVNYRNPHNMLLYEWTANGLAGVLVFLGLIVLGIWSLLVARRRELTTGWGLFASAVIATIIGYHVHNFFNYDVIPTGLHYYVLIAMAVILRRSAGRDAEPSDEPETDGDSDDDAESSDEDAPSETKDGKKKDAKKTRKKKNAPKSGAKKTNKKKDAPKSGAKKTNKKKDAKREAKKLAKREARVAGEREYVWRRQALWLTVGLIGAVVLYLGLHQWPWLRDHFRFILGDLPPRKDGLPALLIVAWGGGWAAAGLLQSNLRSRVAFLIAGLLGLMAIYSAFYAIPGLREALLDKAEEGAPHVRNDILPAIFILSWAGFWTIVGLSVSRFDKPSEPQEEEREADQLAKQNSWALALLLASLMGVGAWWAGRQIKADYHLFRAFAVSRTARARTIPRIQRLDRSIRQLARMKQQARQQGNSRQLQKIRRRMDLYRRKRQHEGRTLMRYLRMVQKHGRIAADAVSMLGYYHFQYSKALHPFLKARSVIDDYPKLVAESLARARRARKQNTNPESTYSHLSVVYLAAGNLQKAKWALAQSIKHDPFYYDTHRMMALLHLQDGHIDEAVKEMDRSLDITEGVHFANRRKYLRQALTFEQQGNDRAAKEAVKKMWYWIHRGRNFPGLPVQLLWWWGEQTASSWQVKLGEALSKNDLKAFGKLQSVYRKAPWPDRVRGLGGRLLFALYDIQRDQSRKALDRLHHMAKPRPPEEDEAVRAMNLASSLGRVDPQLDAFIRLASQGGDSRRLDKALRQLVERASSNDELYVRDLAIRLRTLLQNGKLAEAKKVSRLCARFLHDLAKERLEEEYIPSFKRRYRQVIMAENQVRRAASLPGRMSMGQRFLRRNQPQAALRIADGALRAFGNKANRAYVLQGMALEQLRRTDEALTAYETYLRLAPKASNAEKVRQRISRLQAR